MLQGRSFQLEYSSSLIRLIYNGCFVRNKGTLEDKLLKRMIILVIAILAMILCTGAFADPARTDGKVTVWIGEENAFFIKCTDGVTRKLSAPMKDILKLTETDAIGLTQAGQIISVKKDGSGYSVLSENASDEEIAAQTDKSILLDEQGKLTVGDAVYSERAVAAATDGLVLYWVNRGDNGFILMQKEMPNQEEAAAGRVPAILTGMSVPEPIFLCVTGEALTLTAADRSIICISLESGKSKSFSASGQETTGACMVDDRLYRYDTTALVPWMLETIQNDAMQLETVTPAPTATATATPAPTPQATLVPTAAPGGSSSSKDDGNIYKGAGGRTVRKIQQRLWELGYPVGYVDGSYGDQTQIAVSLFYEAINQKERSYITPQMYQKLFSGSAPYYDPYMPLQKGDRGLRVRMVQTALRKNGFDPVKIDGIYGDMTIQAMANYQKSIGYVPAAGETYGEYASRDLLQKLLGTDPQPVTSTDYGGWGKVFIRELQFTV